MLRFSVATEEREIKYNEGNCERKQTREKRLYATSNISAYNLDNPDDKMRRASLIRNNLENENHWKDERHLKM